MHKKLKHLSESRVNELISRYSKGDRIKDLIAEFEIDCWVGELFGLLPPIISQDKCPYCHVNFRVSREARSTSSYLRGNNPPTCPVCNHKDNELCACDNCENRRWEIKQKQEKEDRIKVESLLTELNPEKINFEEIQFRDRVFLTALVREAYSAEKVLFYSIEHHQNKLAPAPIFSVDILRTLFNHRVIKISDYTKLFHFSDDADNPVSFFDAYWLLNIDNLPSNYLSKLMFPELSFEPDEALELWIQIGVWEIWEYLLYDTRQMLDHTINITQKGNEIFKQILKTYSIGQVIYFAFLSVNRCNRLRKRDDYDGNQFKLVNNIPNLMLQYLDKSIAEQWPMQEKGNFRSSDIPQSTLSEFYFNEVLTIRDNGFLSVPTIENLTNKTIETDSGNESAKT